MSFSPLLFQELQKLLPEFWEMGTLLDMNPNVYYMGQEYRVMYRTDQQKFMCLDDMVAWSDPEFQQDSCTEVRFQQKYIFVITDKTC